jgi:hypothetical protein
MFEISLPGKLRSRERVMNSVEPPLDALVLARQQTAKPETVVAVEHG